MLLLVLSVDRTAELSPGDGSQLSGALALGKPFDSHVPVRERHEALTPN
jgi:hypothetical protein